MACSPGPKACPRCNCVATPPQSERSCSTDTAGETARNRQTRRFDPTGRHRNWRREQPPRLLSRQDRAAEAHQWKLVCLMVPSHFDATGTGSVFVQPTPALSVPQKANDLLAIPPISLLLLTRISRFLDSPTKLCLNLLERTDLLICFLAALVPGFPTGSALPKELLPCQ